MAVRCKKCLADSWWAGGTQEVISGSPILSFPSSFPLDVSGDDIRAGRDVSDPVLGSATGPGLFHHLGQMRKKVGKRWRRWCWWGAVGHTTPVDRLALNRQMSTQQSQAP